MTIRGPNSTGSTPRSRRVYSDVGRRPAWSAEGSGPSLGRGRLRLPRAIVSVRHVNVPVALLRGSIAFVGQLGAPAYRSSQPPAPYRTDQHQHERSDYDPDQRVSWRWWWARPILGPLEQLKVS